MNKAAKVILALLVLAVAASGAWIFFRDGSVEQPRVVIEVDGEVYYTNDWGDTTWVIPISNPNGGENTVQIQPDGVWMESANCPDQICVNQGIITDSSVPIVCLPNKVIVRIEGGASQVDASTK